MHFNFRCRCGSAFELQLKPAVEQKHEINFQTSGPIWNLKDGTEIKCVSCGSIVEVKTSWSAVLKRSKAGARAHPKAGR